MDNPLLKDRLSARIGVESAAVSMPAGHLAALNARAEVHIRRCPQLLDNQIPVARVDRVVLISMEYDRGDNTPPFRIPRAARTRIEHFGLAWQHAL